MSESSAVYDAVELRRRMAVCFSIGELQKLAESLGVGASIAWERGIQEAARDVVKQCERYAGLEALVSKLREVRPLVEWPEPHAPPGGPAVAFPAAPPLAPLPSAPLPTVVSAAPAPAPPVATAIADPFTAPPRSPFAPPAPPPASRPLPAPNAWPGTAIEAPSARGLDPRILVVVGALTVIAALIAYLAGRASNPVTSPAPVASQGVAQQVRAEGLAALAAAAVGRSLQNVARVCELPASAGADDLVFRRVFERCGPAPLPPRAASGPPQSVQAEPTAAAEEPPAADTTPRGRGRRPARGDSVQSDPQPQTKGCMGACDGSHRACKSQCGSEPTEGRAYDAYQRCLGHCLSEASRCRLNCH